MQWCSRRTCGGIIVNILHDQSAYLRLRWIDPRHRDRLADVALEIALVLTLHPISRLLLEAIRIDEPPALDLRRKHTIEAVVDRFKVRSDIGQRLAQLAFDFLLPDAAAISARSASIWDASSTSARAPCALAPGSRHASSARA